MGRGAARPAAAAAARQAHQQRLSDVVLLVPEPEDADPAHRHLALK
jgi:hypothetical protein